MQKLRLENILTLAAALLLGEIGKLDIKRIAAIFQGLENQLNVVLNSAIVEVSDVLALGGCTITTSNLCLTSIRLTRAT